MKNIRKAIFIVVFALIAGAAFSQIKADATGWKKNDFTKEWKDYEWTFSTSTLKAGENSIIFTYTSGAHKLCLKDVVIKADGRTVLTDNTEKSAGNNPKSAEYKFTLTTVPRKLTLTAKARTAGGSDSNGYISFGDRIIDGVLYIGYGQKSIPDKKYKGNQDITEIRFSETVTKIGSNSFQGIKGLKKVVIPGNVKTVGDGAFVSCTNLEEVIIEEGVEIIKSYGFYGCKNLKSVTFPKSIQQIFSEGLFWETNSSIVFHCYAGSEAYNLCLKSNYKVDIIGIDEKNAASITELDFSGNTVINQMNVYCPNLKTIKLGRNVEQIAAEAFRKNDVASIDLNNNLTEIGKNAFNDKTTLRVKRGTYGDKWAKSNGYYLSGVLADINYYTKDRSKQITEDFTRILCDDTPYAEWTSYKFNTQQPLKLEEVDNKLVLTSFMLYPCKNVTVTAPDGKKLISKKTIQPLTRTVLCGFDFMADSVENYTLTTDDAFYKKLVSIPVDWDISFHDWYYRPANMMPVHCRQWIAGIYNVAYIIGLPEYERRCYEAVEKKFLVTNEELTEFLSKEQMGKLLEKARSFSLILCKCADGYGVSGGHPIYLSNSWIVGLSEGTPNGFWHEFSHSMGWGHQHGNMCNNSRPKPYDEDWPTIGSKLLQEEFKNGNVPYCEGETFLNPWFFSYEHMNEPDPEKDAVKNSVLYIGERMPCAESHKNQTDFTKVVFSSSVEILKDSAFYGTSIQEITIPPSVTAIRNSAFNSCTDLKSIVIPNTVKTVGNSAFQDCKSLASAIIGSGLRELNYRIFKGSGLTEITIPGSVKIIGKEAFRDCKKLSKVTIADGVKKICDDAFNNTALRELAIPSSVTEIGKNITSKNVVWIVEEGSYAYDFALKNNFYIKQDAGPLEENVSRILAEIRNAKNVENAPVDSWQKGTFTSKDVRRRWDFSSILNDNGTGEYVITFTYKSGAHKLCLSDALFMADGNAIAFYPEMRSAGLNPTEILYAISVPKGTKKLEFLALAHTAGGNDSNGTITVSMQDDGTLEGIAARIMTESSNAALAPTDKWNKDTFTTNDVRRKWDFSSLLKGNAGGEYVVSFIYTSGNNSLSLSDTLFVADGKPIAHFPEQETTGKDSYQVAYRIDVPKNTKKLEMYALVKKSGGDTNGTVLVETLSNKVTRILSETRKAEIAPSESWGINTFTENDVRRKWDFSSVLSSEDGEIVSGGEYTVSFLYTADGIKANLSDILYLSDVMFFADGKLIQYFPETRTTKLLVAPIEYTIEVPNGTKKLEMSALARNKAGAGSISCRAGGVGTP